VTPPGDVPIVPDGDAASVEGPLLDGAGAEEGVWPPPPDEHAVSTAAMAAAHAAAMGRERQRWERMISIYATLAAMTERSGFRECCRR
jgi:hypothetical protein